MGLRIVGLDGDGPGYQVHGLVVFAGGLRDGPEQTQRVWVVRFDRQNPPVDFLGLEQPPGAVVIDSVVEQKVEGPGIGFGRRAGIALLGVLRGALLGEQLSNERHTSRIRERDSVRTPRRWRAPADRTLPTSPSGRHGTSALRTPPTSRPP